MSHKKSANIKGFKHGHAQWVSSPDSELRNKAKGTECVIEADCLFNIHNELTQTWTPKSSHDHVTGSEMRLF